MVKLFRILSLCASDKRISWCTARSSESERCLDLVIALIIALLVVTCEELFILELQLSPKLESIGLEEYSLRRTGLAVVSWVFLLKVCAN